MRHLLSILFVGFFALSLSAQSAKTAFITDAEVEWLGKEISNLEVCLAKMQTAYDNFDNKAIAANKTDMIKCINRLSSNSKIMYDKIDLEVNPIKSRTRDLDTPPNYYIEKKRKVEELQELTITSKSLATLNENSIAIKERKEKIKNNKYYFHPQYAQSNANLTMVKEMLDYAKNSNNIIQNSKVD
jgi:hypothetical protein